MVGQFIKSGTELPILTKGSLFLSNNIFLIVGVLAILVLSSFFVYKKYIKSKNNLLKASLFFFKIPLVGNFILLTETERFASTMSLLLDSGMNLDVALEELEVFNNAYLKDRIVKSREEVIEAKILLGLLLKVKFSLISLSNLSQVVINLESCQKMFSKVSSFLKNEIESKRSIFYLC